jgi:hypothetical protein
MSDYKIPELPSDDELGITKEDLEKYGSDEEPELSPEERAALLGDAAKRAAQPAADTPAPKKQEGAQKPSAPEGKKKARKEKKPKEPKAPKPPREPKAPSTRPKDTTPRSRWKGPVTLLLLAAGGFLSSSYRAVPRPVPANAPDTVFSSARAMSSLVEIARDAHPVGSAEHARVREYLVSRLQELGLEPSVETATSMVRRGRRVRAATVRNILARIPGTASTGAVLIDAHYDGAGLSHAAADDGSGVVAVLEAVRALEAGPPLKNDIIVLLSDGEELGLMGARAFAEQHPWMADVSVVIDLEMRGAGGPAIMFQTGVDNGWVVRQLQSGDPGAFANSLSYEVYKRLPNDTDFSVFKRAGRQGLDFAGIARARMYHQVFDTPENLSEGTLQHQGMNALGMLRQLGNADLGTVTAPDVAYISVPVLGLVVYPTSWTIPLTAIILLLTVLGFFAVLRKGGTGGGVVAGLVISLVAAAVAGGAGYGLARWLPSIHQELGGLVGSAYYSEGWYVLALLGVALFAVSVLFGLARRKLSLAELALGAAILPVAVATAVTFTAPLAAVDFQWPALAAVAGVLVISMLPGDRPGLLAWLLLLILAVPVLVILVPLTELIWLAGTIRIAMALGVAIAVALLFLLPLLDTLREPNSWWAPVTALVLGAAFLGIGVLQARPSADRPEPSTLVYAMDRGTGEAWWGTDPVDSVAPPDSTPDRARAWARQHAGLSAGFGGRRPFDAFLTSPLSLDAAAATPIDAPLPQVALTADSVEGGERHAHLVARSLTGAEAMVFKLPPPEIATLVAVNGRALPTEGAPGADSVTTPDVLEYWGIPDTLVDLDFRVNPGATSLDLSLVEQVLQPTGLLGPDVFKRPPELTPNVRRPTDRALLRTPFKVDLTTGAVSVVASAPPVTAPTGAAVPAPADTLAAPPPGDSAGVRDTVGTRDTTDVHDTTGLHDTATVRDTAAVARHH